MFYNITSQTNDILDKWKIIVPAIIVFIGWLVNFWIKVNLDKKTKRREIITSYLIQAYRKLEFGSGRENNISDDMKRDMEKAVADIQLFGTKEEFNAVKEFSDTMNEKGKGDARAVLKLLRMNLRKELMLERNNKNSDEIFHWRLK